jgi:hypothetical protein
MNFLTRIPQLKSPFGARRIVTAVDVARSYNINVAKAQGYRNGFTGGTRFMLVSHGIVSTKLL